MNQKQVKLLRKQIRNVVQELLPAVLTQEVVTSISSELKKEVLSRLDAIDARQKDITSFVVRNSVPPAPQPAADKTENNK